MKLTALLPGLFACLVGTVEAAPVKLRFDVPAPCSEAWAQQGGLAAGSQQFGRSCIAHSVTYPLMDRHAVFAAALKAVRNDDRLSDLAPADVSTFCPKYKSLDSAERQVFWAGLLTAIARPESDYNPMDVLWEGNSDPEYSIGLLQISPSNKAAYGCDFNSEAELADPKANLSCGVRIMSARISRGHVIGGAATTGRMGAAAYWSTLRVSAYKPSRTSGRLAQNTREEIIRATETAPGCH